MFIEACELLPLRIPVRPERLSFGSVDTMHYVLVCLKDDEGNEGWGEAAILQGPFWSEESQESVYFTLKNYLLPQIKGHVSEKKLHAILSSIRGNNFAKSALEMAWLDLHCRRSSTPLVKYLGGSKRNRLSISWTIAGSSIEEEAAEAEGRIAMGWKILKLKTGNLSLSEDLERMKVIASLAKGRAGVRVDANQGWDEHRALKAMQLADRLEMDFVEQPLPAWDLEGMHRLADSFTTPVLADEGVCTLHDAQMNIRQKAADAFSYKLEKSGGFRESMQIAALAHRNRIKGYMGCMIETGIGTAAYAAFALACPSLEFGTELFGPLRISADITSGLEYEKGSLLPPEGAGLGISVDRSSIRHFFVKNFC